MFSVFDRLDSGATLLLHRLRIRAEEHLGVVPEDVRGCHRIDVLMNNEFRREMTPEVVKLKRSEVMSAVELSESLREVVGPRG